VVIFASYGSRVIQNMHSVKPSGSRCFVPKSIC
jgi:hypothetical protein